MIRVDLYSPGWHTSGTSRARGHAHRGERFLAAGDIASLFDSCESDIQWIDTLRQLNGCFSVVSVRSDQVLAAVDRIRSIPIFYVRDDNTWRLSDRAEPLCSSATSSRIDDTDDVEFRLTGYVTGSRTLHPRISQIQAGEWVRLAPLRCEASRQAYYVLHHDDFLDSDVADLVERLHAVHGRVFKRLKASLDGRPVILPLSGGYDSRLIATSLRDAGVREVTCYSYGAKDHWESKISREVAAYLGYRWEFVPYSSERWRTWIGTDSFERYFGDAGNLSSVPHVQDWPAVLELKQQGRLAPEAVFVPGHSGDFLAGSHIPKWFGRHAAITRRSLLDTLQDVHYSLWDWPTERRDELAGYSTAGSKRSSVLSPIVHQRRQPTLSSDGTCRSARQSSYAIRCVCTSTSASTGGCRFSTTS